MKTAIEEILSEKLGPLKVEKITPVSGGSINETARVQTTRGIFFVKWNDAERFPNMLETESKGLSILKEANELWTPSVIAQKTVGTVQYLVLESIEPAILSKTFWTDFGSSLARLHRHTSPQFGLDHDNYIGSLPQRNTRHSTWAEFFALERIEPQVKLARDAGKITPSLSKKLAGFLSRAEGLFPKEKPSLLHGDLWSGNFMVRSNGGPALIDPAVYYGHREMDIAMTQLFGGFSPEFYESYNREFPLEKNWQERTELCNLYPLMVHVNLFGGSYALQVENILSRY